MLKLDIKMTDFGLALPLDADREHLSVFGPNGTVVFMAPEAVRQTVSGSRKVSKRVDIWALGVMMYQMLHKGATPVGHYMTKGGPPEALLAVASETVNREAMDFDASEIWQAERARLLRMSATDSLEEQATTADMVHALVVSWVGSEFFVRVCKQCLVFDADNRVDGDDLRGQIDRAIETGWGLEGNVGDGILVASSELLQAAFNIDSKKKDGAVSLVQAVDSEVARIGERIGASLFPTVWADLDPKRSLSKLDRYGIASTRNIDNDLEAQRNSNDQDCRPRPNRLRLFLIVTGLLIVGGLCVIVGLTRSSSGTQDVGPHEPSPSIVKPTGGPAAATVVPSATPSTDHDGATVTHPPPSPPASSSQTSSPLPASHQPSPAASKSNPPASVAASHSPPSSAAASNSPPPQATTTSSSTTTSKAAATPMPPASSANKSPSPTAFPENPQPGFFSENRLILDIVSAYLETLSPVERSRWSECKLSFLKSDRESLKTLLAHYPKPYRSSSPDPTRCSSLLVTGSVSLSLPEPPLLLLSSSEVESLRVWVATRLDDILGIRRTFLGGEDSDSDCDPGGGGEDSDSDPGGGGEDSDSVLSDSDSSDSG